MSYDLLPLDQYDKVIVGYSGGKDCTAATLRLLEMGVPKEKIELWHQRVDGDGEMLFDWPCTEGYCKAAAYNLGIPLRFQWRDGGFHAEMMRENATTNGVYYEDGMGQVRYLPPSSRGKLGTRKKYPQTSADLSVRWCSAYLKIMPCERAINNDVRLQNAKILLVTGERRQESTARSKYQEAAEHACNSKKRRVDQWRAVIDWTEEQVWDIHRRWRVAVHPAYSLGFGRVSCMKCIFADPDQWASIRELDATGFERHVNLEKQTCLTIKRGLTLVDQANKGSSFVTSAPEWLKKLAMSTDYPLDRFFLPEGETWELPAGAYKRCGGPS